jgi:hypothetical protein
MIFRKKLVVSALILILIVAFLHYIQNFPSIFDINLADETKYMAMGKSLTPLPLNNYETSALYGLFYRIVSKVIIDPVNLYMMSGILIVLLAYASIVISILLISRSAVLAALVASILVLSGFFAAVPRLSYLAIVIVSLGTALALHFERVSQKTAILAVTSFLVAFVRPEFVSVFYVMGSIAILSFIWDLWGELRAGRDKAVILVRNTVPFLSVVAVAALSFAWSFPVFSASGRAFAAFEQHYALRYVMERRLTLDPWLSYDQVISKEFPGATTIWEAYKVSPRKVIIFSSGNLRELAATVWIAVSMTVLEHLVFFAISLGVLVGGVLWRLSSARPTLAEARPAISWREGLLDLGLIAILGAPPLLGCILVYPHPHYFVILELAACLFVARALRGVGPDLPPVLAITISVGFILATRPLPVIDQPTLRIIEALRRLPPMRGLIATDGRWCVYLQRPCATYPPDFFQATPLKDETIEAVLLSPTIVNYQKEHPSLQFPFDSSSHPGWTSYRLDEGFSIFYRLPAGNALP